jgi:RND superfamily putative drug exporter
LLFVTAIAKDASKEGGGHGAGPGGRTVGVLLTWLVIACAGIFGWSHLDSRLTSSVEVPGSSSRIASHVLQRHFGDSDKGSFTVLFDAPASRWRSPSFVEDVKSSVERAARVTGGRASPLRSLSARISYADLSTELSAQAARKRTAAIKRAIGSHPETRTKVTGFSVISDELSSIISEDLRRAEIIALPITALILILFFGSLTAAAVPLLFGIATISVGMGVIWIETWFVSIPIYATNVVTLVGIALAIDYSMLYLARYREEARNGLEPARALPATARTAGRALAISGAVVAAGLIPLAFVPIPFFSGLGLATAVIPVVSVLAAVTLLPALLRALSTRLERQPLRPRRRRGRTGATADGLSDRLVDFVMRRAGYIALASATLMLLIALPVSGLDLNGGSSEFTRRAQFQHSADGGDPTSQPLASYEVLIDSGRAAGAWRPRERSAERRMLRDLAAGGEITAIQAPVAARSRAQARRLGLVDQSGRFSQIRIIGAHRSGSSAAEALVERLRSYYVPRGEFGTSRVWVGGASAFDYDFVQAIEGSVPALVLAIVTIMYLLLAVLLRSPILPLKAIAMSAISVAAACGVLVAVFQLGWGGIAGAAQGERIEAWVPVLLFAALFGISTDYEVFMVTRMREEWLRAHNNERAVRTGLRLVGGMITASALVMLAIFAGFTVSRVVGLQQFGIGLVAGVFFDATVVRLLLVPSLMKLMGRWNWSFRAPRPVIPTAPAERWPGGR